MHKAWEFIVILILPQYNMSKIILEAHMKDDQIRPEDPDAIGQQPIQYIPSFDIQIARKAGRSFDIFRYMMMRNYQISRTILNKKPTKGA
jgi:hypothetical protein